jgi:hypothetical protein
MVAMCSCLLRQSAREDRVAREVLRKDPMVRTEVNLGVAEFYEAIVKIRCSADNGLPDE